ncbi:unnamed protein product [Vitrella brassicaformis CCMP3155]|uniref:Uncharacterized protein n=1 Tax=Vitrella brassicaformis (strain CCMP3155) TaxID=1169540 RepID=A0A0G4ENM5_VITBC|nr:unnamed protein product [Vitrella brassicaformis CCMP3155]|eukprot:CEL98552.1 unnamed protein product [Vitrella brassicaformis CCMP3155]
MTSLAKQAAPRSMPLRHLSALPEPTLPPTPKRLPAVLWKHRQKGPPQVSSQLVGITSLLSGTETPSQICSFLRSVARSNQLGMQVVKACLDKVDVPSRLQQFSSKQLCSLVESLRALRCRHEGTQRGVMAAIDPCSPASDMFREDVSSLSATMLHLAEFGGVDGMDMCGEISRALEGWAPHLANPRHLSRLSPKALVRLLQLCVRLDYRSNLLLPALLTHATSHMDAYRPMDIAAVCRAMVQLQYAHRQFFRRTIESVPAMLRGRDWNCQDVVQYLDAFSKLGLPAVLSDTRRLEGKTEGKKTRENDDDKWTDASPLERKRLALRRSQALITDHLLPALSSRMEGMTSSSHCSLLASLARLAQLDIDGLSAEWLVQHDTVVQLVHECKGRLLANPSQLEASHMAMLFLHLGQLEPLLRGRQVPSPPPVHPLDEQPQQSPVGDTTTTMASRHDGGDEVLSQQTETATDLKTSEDSIVHMRPSARRRGGVARERGTGCASGGLPSPRGLLLDDLPITTTRDKPPSDTRELADEDRSGADARESTAQGGGCGFDMREVVVRLVPRILALLEGGLVVRPHHLSIWCSTLAKHRDHSLLEEQLPAITKALCRLVMEHPQVPPVAQWMPQEVSSFTNGLAKLHQKAEQAHARKSRHELRKWQDIEEGQVHELPSLPLMDWLAAHLTTPVAVTTTAAGGAGDGWTVRRRGATQAVLPLADYSVKELCLVAEAFTSVRSPRSDDVCMACQQLFAQRVTELQPVDVAFLLSSFTKRVGLMSEGFLSMLVDRLTDDARSQATLSPSALDASVRWYVAVLELRGMGGATWQGGGSGDGGSGEGRLKLGPLLQRVADTLSSGDNFRLLSASNALHWAYSLSLYHHSHSPAPLVHDNDGNALGHDGQSDSSWEASGAAVRRAVFRRLTSVLAQGRTSSAYPCK